MENSEQKQPERDWEALIEQSDISDLTKEIALAIIELTKMQRGDIQPLTLKDI